MGKSTTAQILARSYDYVYYEADCFGSMKNPYIPLDVENPSMAQIHQKNLAGPGMGGEEGSDPKDPGNVDEFDQRRGLRQGAAD